MEGIISAIITGGLALLGTIVTTRNNSRRLEHQLQVNQAVSDTKLEELTREVREHNDFARRVPVLTEQVAGLDRRLRDLEKEVHNGAH